MNSAFVSYEELWRSRRVFLVTCLQQRNMTTFVVRKCYKFGRGWKRVTYTKTCDFFVVFSFLQ